jgi:tripartite-type tricarboxylate transporter receptor subunit TctC
MLPARFNLVIAAAVAVVVVQSSAAAEDFYAGKTVTIYSGHQPGSLYDTNARFVARHLPRFIPGTPTVIVRNMPGAGTLTASNSCRESRAQGRHRAGAYCTWSGY